MTIQLANNSSFDIINNELLAYLSVSNNYITLSNNLQSSSILDVRGSDGTYNFLAFHPDYDYDSSYLVVNHLKTININNDGFGIWVPSTASWEKNKDLTVEEDLSEEEDVFTPESDFTVDMQHFYKIGHIVFGHIVIHRNSAVSSTGIYKIGTVSVHAQHEHLFTATCYNGSAANSDAAIIKTNGDVMLRLTGTTSASTYNWDLSFFFCEEN